MMRPPINWSDVPTDRPRMLKIVRAPVNGWLHLTILSERDFGVFIHWDDKARRNVPCTDPYGCICQDRAVSYSWRAYLAVQEIHGGKTRIAEVTSEAWIGAQGAKWVAARGSLRGCRLSLSRQPHTPHGKVIAQLHDPVTTEDLALPAAPDVKEEMQRIWYCRL